MRRALLLLVLPVVLAACGGTGLALRDLTPAARVQNAARTTAATSEHISLTVSLSAAGGAVAATGAGDYDSARRLGTFRMTSPLGEIETVVSDTTVYVRSPLSGVGVGKTWLKVDLQKALASTGVDVHALLSQNPARSLALLVALSDVTKVGEETVDGVATTHYRGRVDVTKLPHGAKLRPLTQARYGPYDAWIGKDDAYVRRIRFAYGTSSAARVVVTMNFSDFGKDVRVTVPPESETFDATGLATLGLGG